MKKSESPLSTRLLMAIIASMMGLNVVAVPGEEPDQPKLVLGIVVEDLQEEYINLLRRYFTQGGFNRLLNNGVLLQNVDFGPNLDTTAATALLYTGAAPSVNGIPADEIFDRSTLLGKPIFTDESVMGNYTTRTLSPRALATSTIADEIRISGDGFTYAYAIAPDPGQALVMAGHAGNCGVWLDDANDCWATTTYFKSIPEALNHRNRNQGLKERLDTMSWGPVLSENKYSILPKHLTNGSFHYTFNRKDKDNILRFKNSPCLNTEITDFAIEHINQYDLGAHDGPDIISLAYSLEPYSYSKGADNRFEIVDSYYRLDRDLDRLFKVVDKKVGMPNVLVFVASTPAVTRSRRDDEKWQIPYGEFSTRKAISLLNMYLMAIHGNGNWVEGFHNGEFFLNRSLIEKEDKDLLLMREQTAAFLVQMAGVMDAYTIDDIINHRTHLTISEAAKRNTSIEHAGDVRIKVMPGWELLDDFNNPGQKQNQVVREEATTSPVFIMAPGLAAKTIGTPVDARSIAPTITRLLRIRSPNAASLPPLSLE